MVNAGAMWYHRVVQREIARIRLAECFGPLLQFNGRFAPDGLSAAIEPSQLDELVLFSYRILYVNWKVIQYMAADPAVSERSTMAGTSLRAHPPSRLRRDCGGSSNRSPLKQTITRELLFFSAFLAFGGVAFGSYYLFAERLASPDSLIARYSRNSPWQSRPAPSETHMDTVVLPIHTTVKIDAANLTYRGSPERNYIRIDAVFPDLDTQRAYPYRLRIDTAKTGFRLSGRTWELISWDNTSVEIRKSRNRFGYLP